MTTQWKNDVINDGSLQRVCQEISEKKFQKNCGTFVSNFNGVSTK